MEICVWQIQGSRTDLVTVEERNLLVPAFINFGFQFTNVKMHYVGWR